MDNWPCSLHQTRDAYVSDFQRASGMWMHVEEGGKLFSSVQTPRAASIPEVSRFKAPRSPQLRGGCTAAHLQGAKESDCNGHRETFRGRLSIHATVLYDSFRNADK